MLYLGRDSAFLTDCLDSREALPNEPIATGSTGFTQIQADPIKINWARPPSRAGPIRFICAVNKALKPHLPPSGRFRDGSPALLPSRVLGRPEEHFRPHL